MERFDVIVIGQGYSGLVAAKLAAESGLRTANFETQFMGGLILNVNELDPAPNPEAHSGAELAGNMAMANDEKGVVSVSEAVTSVKPGSGGSWIVEAGPNSYSARHVVVASGARLRKLGVPGETEFFGRGVSECADCDGPMYQDMDTVVVGGGDSAFQEALALSEYAGKVTIIIRGPGPRARRDLVERVLANPKIAQMTETEVLAILGGADGMAQSVRVRSAGTESTLSCAGVFVFIGLDPNTDFLPANLPRDSNGAVIASESCETELKGLWAIGAVRSGYGGILTEAAADAQKALSALSYHKGRNSVS